MHIQYMEYFNETYLSNSPRSSFSWTSVNLQLLYLRLFACFWFLISVIMRPLTLRLFVSNDKYLINILFYMDYWIVLFNLNDLFFCGIYIYVFLNFCHLNILLNENFVLNVGLERVHGFTFGDSLDEDRKSKWLDFRARLDKVQVERYLLIAISDMVWAYL